MLEGVETSESERGLPADRLNEEQKDFIAQARSEVEETINSAVRFAMSHPDLGVGYEETLLELAERVFWKAVFSFDERKIKSKGKNCGQTMTFESWLSTKLNYLAVDALRCLEPNYQSFLEEQKNTDARGSASPGGGRTRRTRHRVQPNRNQSFHEMKPTSEDAPDRWGWLVRLAESHVNKTDHAHREGPVATWDWLTAR